MMIQQCVLNANGSIRIKVDMMKKKRTIGELFKLATENFEKHNPWFKERFLIVKGGHSRSVLKNFDAEAISYGVGFKGFVAIYKNKAGFLKATGYELYWIYSGFSKGKFVDLPFLEADNMIKETNTFSEKLVCPNILEIPRREPPVRIYKSVGKIKYADIHMPYRGYVNDTFELIVEQFKNGKYRGRLKKHYGDARVILEPEIMKMIDFVEEARANKKLMKKTEEEYEKLLEEKDEVFKKKTKNYDLILLEHTIPKEAIEEMQERQLVRRLKNG